MALCVIMRVWLEHHHTMWGRWKMNDINGIGGPPSGVTRLVIGAHFLVVFSCLIFANLSGCAHGKVVGVPPVSATVLSVPHPRVHFATDRWAVTRRGRQAVQQDAAWLKDRPTAVILIE